MSSFVIPCRPLLTLYFSFAPFHVELLNKFRRTAFGSLSLVHSKFKHWIFGTIPNVLQFNEKFKWNDAFFYLIWTFPWLCSCLTNTSPSWYFDMTNIALTNFWHISNYPILGYRIIHSEKWMTTCFVVF